MQEYKLPGFACRGKYSGATQKVDLGTPSAYEGLIAAAMCLFLLSGMWKTDYSIHLCGNIVIYANAVVVISCQLPSQDVVLEQLS